MAKILTPSPLLFLSMFVNFLNSIFFLYLVLVLQSHLNTRFSPTDNDKKVSRKHLHVYVKDVSNRYFLKSLTCQKKSPA